MRGVNGLRTRNSELLLLNVGFRLGVILQATPVAPSSDLKLPEALAPVCKPVREKEREREMPRAVSLAC